MLFHSLVGLFCLLVGAALGDGVLRGNTIHNKAGYVDANDDALHQLERYLFPNKTAKRQAVSRRRLAITKPAFVSDDVACSFCPADKMKYCRILSGLMVQETYLPKDTSKKEICTVLEALGARLSGEIFGNGRAFRDTADCRSKNFPVTVLNQLLTTLNSCLSFFVFKKDMVMQYVCLFYGSDSSQYRNYCVYKEVVTNVGVNDQQQAPRAPCRSFCVQVRLFLCACI